MFGSRPENEKPENEKLNSRFTLIGPLPYCTFNLYVNICMCYDFRTKKKLTLWTLVRIILNLGKQIKSTYRSRECKRALLINKLGFWVCLNTRRALKRDVVLYNFISWQFQFTFCIKNLSEKNREKVGYILV
jgi:hypothetical protein